jgi:hypothetical protein
VKRALVVVASLVLIAMFWVGAANAMSAVRHEPTRPATRGATVTTEVLRVEYQEVQVDLSSVDMHDGGQWEQQPSESHGG